MMTSLAAPFREPDGIVYHGMALAYALSAYVIGLIGIFAEPWVIRIPAVVLLCHGMVIAAYLIHECTHNTIFKSPDANAHLGRLLGWIAGSAYGTFEDIRFKHLRHHVDVDDIAWFDYLRLFERHPVVLRLTRCCEWLYIPAHELLMHGVMMISSFVIPERHGQRTRIVMVILIRCGIFLGVLWYFPGAALLYAAAYMLMLMILRFMDSVQHDYSYNLALYSAAPAPHRGDWDYEQEHTFSNPASISYQGLNWLTLNFGFHNAHHARPATPWYRLPALHRELFGDDPESVIPLTAQLRMFHRFRLARILERGGDVDYRPKPQGAEYLKAARAGVVYGGNAASFLTSF